MITAGERIDYNLTRSLMRSIEAIRHNRISRSDADIHASYFIHDCPRNDHWQNELFYSIYFLFTVYA